VELSLTLPQQGKILIYYFSSIRHNFNYLRFEEVRLYVNVPLILNNLRKEFNILISDGLKVFHGLL
jgi:hypothetical protein